MDILLYFHEHFDISQLEWNYLSLHRTDGRTATEIDGCNNDAFRDSVIYNEKERTRTSLATNLDSLRFAENFVIVWPRL